MQLLGEDGIMDAPYLLPTEDEFPFLVKQLKNEMFNTLNVKEVYADDLLPLKTAK